MGPPRQLAMRRPRFSLRTLLIFTGLVGYLLVTGPYWYRLARIRYREYRIRVIRQELHPTPARRKALSDELAEWYRERDVYPDTGQ